MNVTKRIRQANLGREPERLALKLRAMRADRFAFFRGTSRLFYNRVHASGLGKSAPPVWCCGDLHPENFGSYKGDNRLVYFDITDFDEAALAPATWELVRFVAGVHVGANALGVRAEQAGTLVDTFMQSYVGALADGKARWIERDAATGITAQLMAQLRNRRRVDFLNARTHVVQGARRFLVDGNKTLPATQAEQAMVGDFMRQFAQAQPDPDFFRVRDIARRIAGTASLGIHRYAILVEGKGSPDRNYMLDLKQALGSSLGAHFDALQPRWHSQADRIVTLQHRIQAVPLAFLHAESIGSAAYVLRALQPAEDRLTLSQLVQNPDLFAESMAIMGRCVAWAHLRSSGRQGAAIADELVEFAHKKKWRRALTQLAGTLAAQCGADWNTFCVAYDDGAFQAGDQDG